MNATLTCPTETELEMRDLDYLLMDGEISQEEYARRIEPLLARFREEYELDQE